MIVTQVTPSDGDAIIEGVSVVSEASRALTSAVSESPPVRRSRTFSSERWAN